MFLQLPLPVLVTILIPRVQADVVVHQVAQGVCSLEAPSLDLTTCKNKSNSAPFKKHFKFTSQRQLDK